MFRFYSIQKRPVVILRPMKVDKDGERLQEPIHVTFEDKLFTTEDEKIAEALRALPNFNADYFELDAESGLPAGVGYQGNTVKIAKMDPPSTPIKPIDDPRIDGLVDQVSALTEIMTQVVKMQSAAAATQKPADADLE